MAETLQSLFQGFSTALSASNLFYAFMGCLIGTMVGVLPGVGPLAGISLLLPTTFGLSWGSFWVFDTLLKVPLPRGGFGI